MAFRVWSLLASIPNKLQRIAQEKTATSSGGLLVFKQACWSNAGYWHFSDSDRDRLESVMRFKADIGQVLPMDFGYTHLLI